MPLFCLHSNRRLSCAVLCCALIASWLNAPFMVAVAQESTVNYATNPYIKTYQYQPVSGTPAQQGYQGYTPSASSNYRRTVTQYQPVTPSSWSPAAKILTGTGIGAVTGGVVGLATGLSLRASSRKPVTTIRTTNNVFNTINYGPCHRAVTTARTETQVVRQTGKRLNMSRGSAAARGLGWGMLYGSAAGLVGGLAYAYFTRDPVAVSSSTYR